MIIKEVDDMDLFLGKLCEHTKVWRDSWTDILVNETRLADSFHDVYQTIPRTGDSTIRPEPTPQETMHRVAVLHTSHNELKNDMLEEVAKVEKLMIGPLSDCKTVLKPVKKAIEKREHKKLDYERFQKAVESSKAKKNKTDRDYSAQAKNEAELEKATFAYELADGYIRDNVPPLLSKIVEFLPLVVEIAIQVQFTLLQHSYSAMYHYANEYGFTDPDGDVVVSGWEELFLPIKQQVESELKMIAKGKAVAMPMNVIQDKPVLARLPSISSNPLARGKKPPPPPPPTAATNNILHSPTRGRENSRPGIGHQKSSTSISSASMSSRFSKNEDTSPTLPSARPSVGRIRTSNQSVERDESPPPPLPGPRPSNGVAKKDRPRIGPYGSSYGGGGAVTPTPLAGLRPSALKGSNSSNNVSSVQSTLAGITNPSVGKIGATLTAPTPGAGRSTTPNSFASIAAGKKKPPPPPPKKKFGTNNEVWVKAIFTFEGQDNGDLSFNEGDRIRVIKKTDHVDDWWTGEVNGRKGQFPANYCEPTT
ncbi:hypothetical protein BDD12DRAFT_244376 [Trichophaea hybrida]|nr:hypothetical protein BDD12DRAFT_244376 [Trichophaea hybrida]